MWLTVSLAAFAEMPTIDVDKVVGLPLTIEVIDPSGAPIPRAFVRHPDEGIRHPVNRDTGRWRVDTLYLRDGTEQHHRLGDTVHFQVSAPGYVTQIFEYRVSGIKNVVPIILDPLGSKRQRRRSERQGETIDWVDLLARTMSARQEGAWHAPDLQVSGLDFGPDTLARLAEPANADAHLLAAFSTHLLTQGPQHAEQADAWAVQAMSHASAELQGDAYVDVVDQMFQVRAIAANLQWQQAETEVTRAETARGVREADRARRRAAVVADDWLDYARAAQTPSVQLASALCASAAEDPEHCFVDAL